MNKKVTPAPAHYGIIRQALEHGKHVYTEKTLTDAIDRSGEFVRLAREKGLLIGALTGLLLFVILAIAGFIFVRDAHGSSAILKAAIFLACGAVGGIVGVNLRRRR